MTRDPPVKKLASASDILSFSSQIRKLPSPLFAPPWPNCRLLICLSLLFLHPLPLRAPPPFLGSAPIPLLTPNSTSPFRAPPPPHYFWVAAIPPPPQSQRPPTRTTTALFTSLFPSFYSLPPSFSLSSYSNFPSLLPPLRTNSIRNSYCKFRAGQG